MANEHMQTFAATGFDSGVGSNFDYQVAYRQSSQPYQTHFKQPHTDHTLSRPYSLQTTQGNLVLGLQESSQKTVSYPHQRTLSASGTEHPGFQNLNLSGFQSFRVPPGFVNHNTPINNGHQQNTYQTSLNNGLMQNNNLSSGANSYNQNFNNNFIGSSTSNVNGYTKGTAYDGKFDPIPKTTQNSLAALGVDDDEPEWERVIKNSDLDATGDATQVRAHFKDVAYSLGQGPLSPTHDLSNRTPVTPGGSNISPWGISSAPIYTTSNSGTMNPPQQSAGYVQQSSYSQQYYQPHIQRTMSIGGNQFGYFNMHHDRRPSAPVTMMSSSTEAIGSSQPQDFYTGPSNLRPNSPPGNIYNTPQGMQLPPHMKSGKQAQNNITMSTRTPDIHNASFRLPEWGGLLPRLETHSQHLQDVNAIDLDYSIIKDVIDSELGEVTGSMALYADSVDEIIPNNKSSSPTKTDITEFQSHGIVNDGGNVLMSQTAHPLPPSNITPSVNGDGNIDYVIRQISPPNSSQWAASNSHSGNDNFYANTLSSGQVPSALPISPPVLGNNGHHAQQAFIRSMSPVTQTTMPSQTSIGFTSSTVSSNEIYSTGELATSLDQLSLGPTAIGLNTGSSTNDEVREGSKSSPSPSTSSAKKPLSWAAIAKTAAKPIPLNTTNNSEVFPPSQFSVLPVAALSQSSATHGTPFLPLMNSGIPIHGQPITNSSQKTPPSSAGLGSSWAATAKSSVATRPSSGIAASGKLTPNASVTTMVPVKKELPPSLAQKGFNPKTFNCKPDYARYFVIKSYTEDDVHKSLKYDIWASTDIGNRRLDKAYRESAHNGPIYLFFSVNASGHFCGMAEMVSPVDYTTTSTVWAQDKWKGVFKVRWTFVKDIPNGSLRHIRLINNENKPVTNSRDTQELYPEPGREMLKVFNDYKSRTSILDDFEWYDQKQTEQKKDGEALEGTGDRREEAQEVED